ncbi:hypothetical protein ON010_g14236 [Phytophthora cinnamomi]|nr:hypothetical protein ON010_g14236 [Phytophthora cinnamomi]
MVKMPTSARSGTPATAGGRSSARPRSADVTTRATASTPRSVEFNQVDDRGHGSGIDEDGSEDAVEMKGSVPMLDDDEVDELTVVVGKSGTPRPIARRPEAELDELTPARNLVHDERATTGSRPPVNGDTPNAYKILGQIRRSMTATSAWAMMFALKEVGGAKWVTLEKELAAPINSSRLAQLGEQVMGDECAAVPPKVALAVWNLSEVSTELSKWKRKLKDAFGVCGTSTVRKLGDVDPSTVPLPTTPKKSSMDPLLRTPDTKRNVFSKTIDSPYFIDSHMVTPKKDRESRRISPAGSIGDDDDQ